MAAEPHQELIIIKRHGGHHDGHHGGAWKIAFADFMTAMMALFLVLWLISATNPKQRIVIAHYFNPVKLAEVSVNKKGLDDPNSSGTAHGSHKSDEPGDKRLELPPMQDNEKRALFDRGEPIPKHDEATLLRDPYAVLSEIEAAAKHADQAKADQKAAAASAAPAISKSDAQPSDLDDSFRDPFSTVPSTDPQQQSDAGSGGGAGASANSASADSSDKPASDAAAMKAADAAAAQMQGPVQPAVAPPPPIPEKAAPPSKDAAKNAAQARLTAEQQAALDTRANEAEAGKVRSEIADAIHKDAAATGIPNVEVKSTAEGVLISVTDENNYAMFSVGSAEPQPKTIEIMGKVAQLLKSHQGLIVVRGHTDGRPYKSATYDNWQLSAARAQMAHYMLVHAGFDEKRIDRIEGYADHQLKLPNDPLAAQNRRIEILLRKDKP